MHLLWPSATPAAARNNLNVAVHRLRRFLSEDERARMVVYRQNGYELDPTLPVWLDLDAFLNRAAAARECARADDRSGELRELRAAEELYGGPLFEDDRYEEWIFGRRRMVLDSTSTCSTYWPVATGIPAISTAASTPPGRSSTSSQHTRSRIGR